MLTLCLVEEERVPSEQHSPGTTWLSAPAFLAKVGLHLLILSRVFSQLIIDHLKVPHAPTSYVHCLVVVTFNRKTHIP